MVSYLKDFIGGAIFLNILVALIFTILCIAGLIAGADNFSFTIRQVLAMIFLCSIVGGFSAILAFVED